MFHRSLSEVQWSFSQFTPKFNRQVLHLIVLLLLDCQRRMQKAMGEFFSNNVWQRFLQYG